VAVREIPGSDLVRDIYAVVRAASIRRPPVAFILAALDAGAKNLAGRGLRGQPR
jgi:hypothetical protein